MILHNLIIAVRNLLKYKTQNVIAILGLSVALLCFSICLYCTRYIYSTNQCFENLDRLVQMSTANKENGKERSYTFCDFSVELKKLSLPEVETYIYTNYAESRPYNIEVTTEKLLPYTLKFMETQPSYFQAFTPKVLSGSWEQAAHAPNSVILSESTAKRIFGKAEQAIGKQMFLTMRLGTSPVISVLGKAYSQMYTVFIDMGVGFYMGVFLCITIIIALTVGFRIYRITQLNPATIIKKE